MCLRRRRASRRPDGRRAPKLKEHALAPPHASPAHPARDMAMPGTGARGTRGVWGVPGGGCLALPGGPPAELFQVRPKHRSDVLAPEGRIDECLDVALPVPGVIARALQLNRPD